MDKHMVNQLAQRRFWPKRAQRLRAYLGGRAARCVVVVVILCGTVISAKPVVDLAGVDASRAFSRQRRPDEVGAREASR